MINNIKGVILISGAVFILSLIVNVKDSKISGIITSGLKFTLISLPPVFLCYLGITIKALTEGH